MKITSIKLVLKGIVRFCCENCSYYFVNTVNGICTFDKEQISHFLAELKNCKAFNLWWGAVE
ncbi:hypothetical protein LCGC14_0809810 [marine sediment metagenome]|uniref:Uncharacterized protein n=1 Tax=marine sediment metagenome TaxID=412755 RepID=A0A0F9PRM8_9ZZZZ|nr:MAG: hypothetical protein Lokiarch_40160 [Candidatus Lokiarchaeum sp. GC14_75]